MSIQVASAVSELTAEEVQRLSTYLHDTSGALIKAVSGLTDAQWQFKPVPDCWSIAEILEHIVIVETRVHNNVRAMPDLPAPSDDWNQKLVDASVLGSVLDRSKRVLAPPAICPTGSVAGTDSVEAFKRLREETKELLNAPCLRGHVAAHPIAGAWDGYQWLLAIAAHSARHTAQIHEARGDGHFPGRN